MVYPLPWGFFGRIGSGQSSAPEDGWGTWLACARKTHGLAIVSKQRFGTLGASREGVLESAFVGFFITKKAKKGSNDHDY